MRRQERGRREREEKGEREGEEGGGRKDEEGRRENGGMQELLRWTMLRRSSAMLHVVAKLGIGELCSTFALLCYASNAGKTLLLCSYYTS